MNIIKSILMPLFAIITFVDSLVQETIYNKPELKGVTFFNENLYPDENYVNCCCR